MMVIGPWKHLDTIGTLAVSYKETLRQLRLFFHLSHEETSTTKKHYVAPGAAEAAQLERALTVIAGGSADAVE